MADETATPIEAEVVADLADAKAAAEEMAGEAKTDAVELGTEVEGQAKADAAEAEGDAKKLGAEAKAEAKKIADEAKKLAGEAEAAVVAEVNKVARAIGLHRNV